MTNQTYETILNMLGYLSKEDLVQLINDASNWLLLRLDSVNAEPKYTSIDTVTQAQAEYSSTMSAKDKVRRAMFK